MFLSFFFIIFAKKNFMSKKMLHDFISFLRDYNMDVGESQDQLIEEFLNQRMDVDSYTKQVKEFHKKFKHPILYEPTIPSKERCQLRINLLQEELNELKDAIDDHKIVDIADALTDIQYVLSGAYLEFGMQEIMPLFFKEVHRSNMSKACQTEQEAIDTVEYYKKERGYDSYYEQNSDGTYLVYRKGDNKTLKNINYSPADLRKIIVK